MSYTSRVYRQRNAHTPDEANKEPFFTKQNDASKTHQPGAFFQSKLTVNQPGDSYEQEADSVASAVVNKTSTSPVVQHKKISSIQRLSTPVEDEKYGTNDARMAKDKEIQEKPIQRMTYSPEKEKPEGIQKAELPEKEKKEAIQSKENPEAKEEDKTNTNGVQTKAAGHATAASPQIASRLESSSGKGNALPAKTKNEMSSSFGVDFSLVRIHKDSEAVSMNKELQAQAFTRGSDIYFNEGKFDPDTNDGKFLLAHELTHVVQQDSGILQAYGPMHGSVTATREVLQRQPMSQQSKPEIKFRIGWLIDDGIPVETNDQVAAIARLTIASLQEDLVDVESAAVKTKVTEWIATVNGALPYFDRHAGEKVDPSIIPLINFQYDELLEVRAAVHQDKLIQIKEALWREHGAAIKAAKEAEALQPGLDDALRSAYRKGSSSTVKDVVSTMKGALSVGRSLRALAADITTDIMGLPLASGTKIYVDHWTSQIGTPRITIINVGKYTDKLTNLGRGLSALNVVLTIADRSKKATEAEQGIKDLSDAANIGTDLVSASSLAAPPHFSLYSTLYLKPALKIISKQIGVLVESLSDVNRIAIEVTGDLMYPNAEPGGQKMFDLMVKVMHADDESGFPALPQSVQEYLFDHREKLTVGAESEVPTEGSWFWKKLDGPAARRWLFANRNRVWAIFYGSVKVPGNKQ